MEKGKEAKYILMDSAGFENSLLENDEFINDPNLLREDDTLKLLKKIASAFFILTCILLKKIIFLIFKLNRMGKR